MTHAPNETDAYTQWRSECARNFRILAELRHEPESALRQIAQVEQWSNRALDDDARDIEHATRAAVMTLSAGLGDAARLAVAALSVTVSERGRIAEGQPHNIALSGAWQLLRTFGIDRARIAALVVPVSSAEAGITAHQLRELVASGDVDVLLALAQGRTPTLRDNPATHPTPPDFLSAYADGRAGSGSLKSVSQPSAELSPEAWDAEQAIEAEIVERASGKRQRER